MNHRWLRTVFLTSIVAGAFIFVITGTRAQGGSSQTSPDVRTAEQAFKNIQVLKGIPSDQLIPSMQFMSNSLGVECAFCHDETAFEKDGNEAKATARTMIRMQMAINKDHFDGHPEITCYSCHRGAHEPVGVPIIADEEPKHTEAKTGTALPTADQILDKYIQASGEADALKKITSRSSKGAINFGERKVPLEVFAKAPGQRLSIMHTPNGDSITAYDGHSGWLGNPGGNPPRDMTAAEAEAAQFDADFYLPLDLKKMFDQFRVRAADKIGDHEVILVIGMKQGRPPLRLFFDQQSGLLVRSIRYAETPLGRNPTQLDYADYREQNGVKLPFRWTLARPLGRFTIQIDQMQQNVPIDDSKFAKPAAAAKADAQK